MFFSKYDRLRGADSFVFIEHFTETRRGGWEAIEHWGGPDNDNRAESVSGKENK